MSRADTLPADVVRDRVATAQISLGNLDAVLGAAERWLLTIHQPERDDIIGLQGVVLAARDLLQVTVQRLEAVNLLPAHPVTDDERRRLAG